MVSLSHGHSVPQRALAREEDTLSGMRGRVETISSFTE